MKRVIVLFAVIFAFAANSFAQTGSQTDNQAAPSTTKMEKRKGGKPKGDQKAAAKSMKKELGLTSEQEMRMKDIGGTYRGKMKAVHSDNTLSKEQKKTQMAELKKAHEAELKGVMNGDQYAKYTELRKNMKAQKGKGAGKGHGAGKRPNGAAPKSN